MNNAKKFKETFGMYATELWAMPEGEFLKWLNAPFTECKEERDLKVVIAQSFGESDRIIEGE